MCGQPLWNGFVARPAEQQDGHGGMVKEEKTDIPRDRYVKER